jgi:hypothetical protein
MNITPGPKKTGKKFLEMLARHLSDKKAPGHASALAEKMSQSTRFRVAYLHYTPAQISLFLSKSKGGRNLNASSPIDWQLAKNTCHNNIPDPHDKNDNGMFYISPNVPEMDVMVEVQKIESSRNARTASRTERRAVAVEAVKTKDDVCRERDCARIDKARAIMAKDSVIESKDAVIESLKKTLKQKDTCIADLRQKLQGSKTKVQPATTSATATFSNEPQPSGNTNKSNTNLPEIMSILVECGGLSRVSLTSDNWHNKYNATVNILGFSSLAEAKTVVKDLFPWVDTELVGKLVIRSRGKTKGKPTMMPIGLTDFEQCLATKMFMQSIPQRQRLATIWGVGPSTMGRYLKEWLPYWGKAGEFLSILHITPDYLESERPDEYYREGLEDVGSLVDGKDFLIEVKRKDKAIQRIQISSKVNAAAARCLTWSTPMGLVHEYTKLFGGRVPETTLVRLWGSLGIEYCKVRNWKDWARYNGQDQRQKLKLQTAIDDVDVKLVDGGDDNDNSDECLDDNEIGLENENALAAAAQEEEDLNDDVMLDDDIVQDPNEQDINDEEYLSSIDESDSESEEGMLGLVTQNPNATMGTKAGNYIMCIDECFARYKHRQKALKVTETDTTKKTPYLLSAEQIENESLNALQAGPFSSPEEFVAQLECHERLHQSFQQFKIRRCSLSYYLLFFEKERHDLLAWVGSPDTPTGHPVPQVPPTIALRLAKIGPNMAILADKGFIDTNRDYPFFNRNRCPRSMRGCKSKQQEPEDHLRQKGDRAICRLRYTSEVVFSFTTLLASLQDVIDYENIKYLPHLHAWGHAHANLRGPLRMPGRKSVVPQDYWRSLFKDEANFKKAFNM